jgi:hypothetical protein
MKTLLLLTLFAASPALAGTESALMSWDGCTPTVQDKEFAGPGLYSVTVSVTGSARTIQGFELQIEVMAPLAECQRGTFAPAWEFDAGGCNAGRWTVDYTGGDCPSPTGSFQATYSSYAEGLYSMARRIHIAAAFAQPVTLEAGKTYHLATLTFDHGLSVKGVSAHPDSCGGVDDPMCLYLSAASWIDGQGGSGLWNATIPGLTWNGNAGYYGCPFLCDPAERATWGSVKAQYR